jgi:transposase InsO family protein
VRFLRRLMGILSAFVMLKPIISKLTRHQVVTPEPKKRPRSSWLRFTYPAPNACWQLDGLEITLDDTTSRVIMQVEDDHSRKILASGVSIKETGAAAIEVVTAAISQHGIPQKFLTDNHLALNQHRRGRTAPLEKFLQSLGVHTMSGRIEHPQTQGKNERLHRTLLKFLEARRPIYTTEQLIELVNEFTDYYNQERAHQALNPVAHQFPTITPDQAYRATSKAPPPQLVEPGPKSPKPARRIKGQTPPISDELDAMGSAERKVSSRGDIDICRCRIYVGMRYVGKMMPVLWDLHKITVFDPEGTEIGSITRPTPPVIGRPPRYSLSPRGFRCG